MELQLTSAVGRRKRLPLALAAEFRYVGLTAGIRGSLARQQYQSANAILAAAREASVSPSDLRMVRGDLAAQVVDRVLENFTRQGMANRGRHWLWEDFRAPTGSRGDVDALSAFSALGVPTLPIWLLVEREVLNRRTLSFWVFDAKLSAALATLGNHHFREFYVVSRRFDWLVCENHHGAVFGVGAHALDVLQAPDVPPEVPATAAAQHGIAADEYRRSAQAPPSGTRG